MRTLPRWYWPVALLPIGLFVLIGSVVVRGRLLASLRNEALTMALALYSAFVLLGYLLLVLTPARPRPSAARPINR